MYNWKGTAPLQQSTGGIITVANPLRVIQRSHKQRQLRTGFLFSDHEGLQRGRIDRPHRVVLAFGEVEVLDQIAYGDFHLEHRYDQRMSIHKSKSKSAALTKTVANTYSRALGERKVAVDPASQFGGGG